MSDKVKVDPLDSQKSEAKKISYTQELVLKRKLALESATRAYQTALHKREQELGKLCLECGLGDYDTKFLKDHLLQLVKGLPKSQKGA